MKMIFIFIIIILTLMSNKKTLYGKEGESFEKCSILFKVKKDENFNLRNTFSILRIKILV
jgi:hypothetical protein